MLAHPAAAELLLGHSQQAVEIGVAGNAEGDPDPCRDTDVVVHVVEAERDAELLGDALAERLNGEGVGGGGDEQGELVAADSSEHVLGAGQVGQPTGDGLQHAITDVEPVEIVDRLHPADAHVDQRHRVAALGDEIVERDRGGQTEQGVDRRARMQPVPHRAQATSLDHERRLHCKRPQDVEFPLPRRLGHRRLDHGDHPVRSSVRGDLRDEHLRTGTVREQFAQQVGVVSDPRRPTRRRARRDERLGVGVGTRGPGGRAIRRPAELPPAAVDVQHDDGLLGAGGDDGAGRQRRHDVAGIRRLGEGEQGALDLLELLGPHPELMRRVDTHTEDGDERHQQPEVGGAGLGDGAETQAEARTEHGHHQRDGGGGPQGLTQLDTLGEP